MLLRLHVAWLTGINTRKKCKAARQQGVLASPMASKWNQARNSTSLAPLSFPKKIIVLNNGIFADGAKDRRRRAARLGGAQDAILVEALVRRQGFFSKLTISPAQGAGLSSQHLTTLPLVISIRRQPLRDCGTFSGRFADFNPFLEGLHKGAESSSWMLTSSRPLSRLTSFAPVAPMGHILTAVQPAHKSKQAWRFPCLQATRRYLTAHQCPTEARNNGKNTDSSFQLLPL